MSLAHPPRRNQAEQDVPLHVLTGDVSLAGFPGGLAVILPQAVYAVQALLYQ
jgi:hypothetical protein